MENEMYGFGGAFRFPVPPFVFWKKSNKFQDMQKMFFACDRVENLDLLLWNTNLISPPVPF